jgi:hypothetical protein
MEEDGAVSIPPRRTTSPQPARPGGASNQATRPVPPRGVPPKR